MSQQSDVALANQGFADFRSELNLILAAFNTNHSGSSRPASAVAGSFWLDSTSATAPILKHYDGSDDITVMTFNYSGNSSDLRTQGLETIWVPAAAMRPTSSTGCAAITDVATTSGRPDMQVLDFDASSDEHAQFQVSMPKSWNEGTITYQAYWTTTASDTDGVAWGLQGVAVSDNDTIDVAYGTPIVVTDDALGAAEDLMVTAASSAVTLGGSPAVGDLCFFRIYRDVSDANDDMAEDARLIGVKMLFTTDAGNDD